MAACPFCSEAAPDGSRFCPNCGAALETPSSTPTETSFGSGEGDSPLRGQSPGSPGRFLPGTVLANRYRIIALLGRGGMGEVYRADDLKLGQPVALKFLPEAVERDASRLNRFLNEVKTALKVTHPNVCRVYDIGEVDDQHYISMEYVDGEDLASLLRRIGRLPRDKAAQIARQLCAGLAAAHEEGILHRDLKPANVMIDGRGRAKITDFGLASLAGAVRGEEARSGTPFYMAPEQLAGKEAAAKSDIYSLGLVLYELFTGKRAFEAETPAEMLRLEQSSAPTSPSSHVAGLDPAVERAILRCLEREPANRPPSALSVAASLPGGDPLAAALAAGETPSPEMVADAGGVGGLRPGVVLSCLAFIAAVFALWSLVEPRYAESGGLAGWVSLPRPPVVLAQNATEILESLGHSDLPADRKWGFSVNQEYLDWVESSDSSPDRWERLRTSRPPGVSFWYRQSPRQLNPLLVWPGVVDRTDPYPRFSGEVSLELDPEGRLRTLRAIPPERVSGDSGEARAPDWTALLAAAGFDEASLTAATPEWTPEDYSDTRAAWEGSYTEAPQIPIRIEAAAFGGKPVFFRIVEPWTRADRMEQDEPGTAERASTLLFVGLFTTMMVGAAVLARRNVKAGRADVRGATRLALFFLAALMIRWAFASNHLASAVGEFDLLTDALLFSLWASTLIWLSYVALEPFLRRRWPKALVSWSRVLAGRFRDPLVGRHLLVGMVTYCAFVLASLGSVAAQRWLGLPPPSPLWYGQLDALLGPRQIVASTIDAFLASIAGALIFLFLFLLLKVILRKEWLAILALLSVSALSILQAFEPPGVFFILAVQMIWWGTFFFLLSRFGLVSVCAAWVANMLAFNLPSSFAPWYAGSSLVFLFAMAALTLYGAYTSLAGQAILKKGLVPQEE